MHLLGQDELTRQVGTTATGGLRPHVGLQPDASQTSLSQPTLLSWTEDLAMDRVKRTETVPSKVCVKSQSGQGVQVLSTDGSGWGAQNLRNTSALVLDVWNAGS